MRKIIILAVVAAFLFNLIPTLPPHTVEAQLVQPLTVLTHEDAKKYEGLITANLYRTTIVQEDGTVVTTNGSGGFQQMTQWENIIAVDSSNNHTVGLKNDGTAIALGGSTSSTNVTGWTNLVAISAGADHTVGLKDDGTVVAVGNNKDGQLYTFWNDIVAISAGAKHTVGVKTDGTVVATGNNQEKQLNVSYWTDIISVSAGEYHTVGLKKDGTVVATGSNHFGETNVSSWSNIVAISAGEYYTLGLKSDGTVVSTGENSFDRLQTSNWKNIIAISAGVIHSVAMRADGSVVAAGNYNWNGQLNVDGWQGMVEVENNGQHVVGLRADGTVVGNGTNYNGQLNFQNWRDIISIETGDNHTVGLKKDGTVVAVGNLSSDRGQTNVSTWTDIVQISVGNGFTLGLKKDGTVVATGDNYYGQINVSDWRDIVAISAGSSQTLGLKADGTVVATGYEGDGNSFRELAAWSDVVAIASGGNYSIGLKSDGTLVTAGSNQSGALNVTEWNNIIDIYAGYGLTIGLKSDGTLIGAGTYWEDHKSELSKWKDIVHLSTKNALVGLQKDGTVYTSGENAAGELNVMPLNHKLTGIVSSIQLTKDVSKGEDTITATFHFVKPMNPEMNVTLLGAINTGPTLATPVAGTNNQVFQYTFTTPKTISGDVHFLLSNVVDVDGFEYQDVYANHYLNIDNEAPIFYGINDISVNAGTTLDLSEDVSAYDRSEGFIPSSRWVIDGEVDTHKLGNYQITYRTNDIAGNVITGTRTIQVIDTEQPVLHGITDTTIKMGDNFDPRAGITATDNVDRDITSKIVVDGTVNTLTPGEYKIRYSVTDSSQNTSTQDRMVNVIDATPPTAPFVEPITDLQWNMHGTSESGTTIVASVNDKEIGRTIASSDGNFSIEVNKQKAGSSIDVIAIDLAGNVSEVTKVMVSDALPQLEQLIGENRYQTAIEISKRGWDTSGTVFLVNGRAIADGLTATPLASANHAPILLTMTDEIPADTLAEIKRLNAKKVILIGGNSVISDKVMHTLSSTGYSVTRIGGNTRYETSLLIAKELDQINDVHTIYVAYGRGEPDALSIAAQSGYTKQPIILTEKSVFPVNTHQWLMNEELDTAYFIGGTSVIEPSIISKIDAITKQNVTANRISGANRQETNAKVIETFYHQDDMPTIMVAHASSEKLVDALAAGPLAAKYNVPVLLVTNELDSSQSNVLQNKASLDVTQIGGGLPTNVIDKVIKLMNE